MKTETNKTDPAGNENSHLKSGIVVTSRSLASKLVVLPAPLLVAGHLPLEEDNLLLLLLLHLGELH